MMFKTVLDLLAHKQLALEEGSITLFGQPLLMTPIATLVEIQKILEKTGDEHVLYKGAKVSGAAWIRNMLKSYKMNTIEEQVRWAAEAFTLAGHGKVKVTSFDVKRATMILQVYDSAVSKAYGKSNHAVDHIARGLFAGPCCVFFKKDVDALEVMCQAKGDGYCKFLVMPKEGFDLGVMDREFRQQLKTMKSRVR